MFFFQGFRRPPETSGCDCGFRRRVETAQARVKILLLARAGVTQMFQHPQHLGDELAVRDVAVLHLLD